MKGLCLVDGLYSDQLAVDDRGLSYGDGLFETIAVEAGSPQFLALHIRRLQNSCARLAINLDFSILDQEINSFLADNKNLCADRAVLKIMITRQAGERGYRASSTAGSHRILQLTPVVRGLQPELQKGIKLRVCDTRLSINPLLAGMKHLCRLENVLARAEWNDEDIFEGLLLDTEGYVTEGVMSNVFMIKDGLLITPHLDRCGVAGVVREVVLKRLAPRLQLPVSLDRLLLEQLNDADEVFICNSVLGIVPVIAVGSFVKKIGSVTQLLIKAFLEEKINDGTELRVKVQND